MTTNSVMTNHKKRPCTVKLANGNVFSPSGCESEVRVYTNCASTSMQIHEAIQDQRHFFKELSGHSEEVYSLTGVDPVGRVYGVAAPPGLLFSRCYMYKFFNACTVHTSTVHNLNCAIMQNTVRSCKISERLIGMHHCNPFFLDLPLSRLCIIIKSH